MTFQIGISLLQAYAKMPRKLADAIDDIICFIVLFHTL